MREAPDDCVDENEDGVWSWGETDKKNRDYSWQKWLEHRKRSAKDSMDPEVHRWNADERRAWEAHRETPRSGNPKNWEYRRGSYYDYRPAYLPKYETRRGWPDAAKIADYWDEVDEVVPDHIVVEVLGHHPLEVDVHHPLEGGVVVVDRLDVEALRGVALAGDEARKSIQYLRKTRYRIERKSRRTTRSPGARVCLMAAKAALRPVGSEVDEITHPATAGTGRWRRSIRPPRQSGPDGLRRRVPF